MVACKLSEIYRLVVSNVSEAHRRHKFNVSTVLGLFDPDGGSTLVRKGGNYMYLPVDTAQHLRRLAWPHYVCVSASAATRFSQGVFPKKYPCSSKKISNFFDCTYLETIRQSLRSYSHTNVMKETKTNA